MPKLLWANLYCLLDTSSGASMSVRQMLHQLKDRGWEVQILGATIFDTPTGAERLNKAAAAVADSRHCNGHKFDHLANNTSQPRLVT